MEGTLVLLLVIPVSHEEHIPREGYDHWSSSMLARFTYKVSVVPLLNPFRFGPWISIALFHTTHRQVLQIHRRDKNVSTTHISLYKYGNVTEIRTFGKPQRETSLLRVHLHFQCVFTVRSLVSIVMPCSFTCDYQRHGDTWNLKTSVTMTHRKTVIMVQAIGRQSFIAEVRVESQACSWETCSGKSVAGRFFSANYNYPLSASFRHRSVLIHSSTTDTWKLRQIK